MTGGPGAAWGWEFRVKLDEPVGEHGPGAGHVTDAQPHEHERVIPHAQERERERKGHPEPDLLLQGEFCS